MIANLFAALPAESAEELVDLLLRRPGVRIERIVSTGQASPPGFWYDQDDDEWVLLLQGSAGLSVEGEAGVLVLGPGDHIYLAAHRRHRVEWTDGGGPTVWLAVHLAAGGGGEA